MSSSLRFTRTGLSISSVRTAKKKWKDPYKHASNVEPQTLPLNLIAKFNSRT